MRCSLGMWVKLLLMPKRLLFGGILVLASLGCYSLNGSLFDLGLMYVVGVAEQHFRRAMAIGQGDVTVFLTRPISGMIALVTSGY